MNNSIRLDSHLARLGIASRRNIARVLQEKTVAINGKRVTEPGIRVDPKTDHISLNGKSITKPPLVYFLVYKPKGYISSAADENGRKQVTDLVTTPYRIYPVGRLDKESHGIMLLTNDGELSNLLTHPRYHIPKAYEVLIHGKVADHKLLKLRSGVKLADGMTLPAEIKVQNQTHSKTLLQIVLYEGKKRQIRRMCEALELPLMDLKRVKFGPLSLGKLQPGNYRAVAKVELQLLKQTTQ